MRSTNFLSFTVLFLLQVIYAASTIDVYISQEDLEDYFPNDTFDAHLYIIQNSTSFVSNNGLLQYNQTDFPPFPSSVDDIIISWTTDIQGQYNISYAVKEITSGTLKPQTLSITDNINTSYFNFEFRCFSNATRAQVSLRMDVTMDTDVTVDTDVTMDTNTISVEFILRKICNDFMITSSDLTYSTTNAPMEGSETLTLMPSVTGVQPTSHGGDMLSSLLLFSFIDTTLSPSAEITSLVEMESSMILIPSTLPLELIPSSSGEVIPSSPVEVAAPSSPVEVAPSSSVEVVPSSSVEVVPSSSVEVAPSSSVEVVPSSSVEVAPSSSVEVVPSSSVEVAPSSSVEVVPSSSVEVAPSSSVEVVPSSPLSSPVVIVPSSSGEVVPSSPIEVASSSSVEVAPLSSVEVVPSSSVEVVPSLSEEVIPSESSSLIINSTSSVTPPTQDTVKLYVAAFTPIAGFLLIGILMIICGLCYVKCHKKRNRNGGFSDFPYETPYIDDILDIEEEHSNKYKKLESPISVWMNSPWGYVDSLPASSQNLLRIVNIDRKKMALTNTFLRGTNGCLSHGMLMTDRINPSSDNNTGAIFKILTAERARREDIVRFIEQTSFMQGLEHSNILPLMGLSIENNCVPIALYPFTEYGNLHVFLELCRIMPEQSQLDSVNKELKINFSYQLSSAMKFLSDNKIIHHDLALRNCWLDVGFVLKLSDGALSQEFFPDCYTSIKGTVRPVKWAAIETLQEGLITHQSNVWSFAVVVWEIFSIAKEPYGEVPNRTILSHLMMEERLHSPSDDCPDSLFSLMQLCWRRRGEDRPRFGTLHSTLNELNHHYSPSIQEPPLAQRHSYRSSNPNITVSTFGKETTIMAEHHSDHQPSHGHRGFKRTSDHHRSSSSIGRVSKVSLSFSILDDNLGDGLNSGSESEEDGSFPSTLKSRTSINAATTNQNHLTVADSITTLQPVSPTLPCQPSPCQPPVPPPISPEIPSKSSQSVSNSSSIVMPAANSSTDRSSFYSTGIDSIGTAFSTPLPSSRSSNHNHDVIEMKTLAASTTDDHGMLRPLDPLRSSNSTNKPFKSTDSGIRSDEDSNSSAGSNLPNDYPHVELRNQQLDKVKRDEAASTGSRTSFGLGDLSDIMATFDTFSTFKPNS